MIFSLETNPPLKKDLAIHSLQKCRLTNTPCVWCPTTVPNGTPPQLRQAYSRESIRIARTTRELLKRFVAAYHAFVDMEALEFEQNWSKMKKTFDIGGPKKNHFM